MLIELLRLLIQASLQLHPEQAATQVYISDFPDDPGLDSNVILVRELEGETESRLAIDTRNFQVLTRGRRYVTIKTELEDIKHQLQSFQALPWIGFDVVGIWVTTPMDLGLDERGRHLGALDLKVRVNYTGMATGNRERV